MTVEDHIENAVIVCPVSKKPLKFLTTENVLKTIDESYTYPLYRNIPILSEEKEKIDTCLLSSPEMLEEYKNFASSAISKELPKKSYRVFARVFIRQFDRLLNNEINSHKMASTTYLVAEKAI